MAKATERLSKALDDLRKAGTDKAKIDAATKDVDAAAAQLDKELDRLEKENADQKKAAGQRPQAGPGGPQEAEDPDAVSTSNLAPDEDFDYDRERLMQAPLSAGERAALDDPAYSESAETDWLHLQEPYKSPIEKALESPKLSLMRARRI